MVSLKILQPTEVAPAQNNSPTANPPPDSLLVMVHQALHHEGTTSFGIDKVLSMNRTKPTATHQTKVHGCYVFRHTNTASHQLVDRGTNGDKTGCKINILSIDSNGLTGLNIVTAVSLLETNQGRVISII